MKLFLTVIGHVIFIMLTLKLIIFVLPHEITAIYMFACTALLCVMISINTFGITKNVFLNEKIKPFKKAVFITGCDSGFGHQLAKRLDSRGFHVFASCLFPSGTGATTLTESCSQRLKVLELNVTKDDSVKKAVEFVNSNLGSCELWAVVNNAGIHTGFSVEMTGIDEFQEAMEVNALGQVRVTKAFLPLLKQSKGRVVNVTSMAGRVSSPFVATYFMSKQAATSFSDCLRQELDMWGIRVSSVEPEFFQTNMTDWKTINEKLTRVRDYCEKHYEGKYFKILKNSYHFYCSNASGKIELVIDDLESAIASKYPSSVYKTRRNVFTTLLVWILEVMPIDIRDFTFKIMLLIFDRIL